MGYSGGDAIFGIMNSNNKIKYSVKRILLFILLFYGSRAIAQEQDTAHTDTTNVRIYYHVGRSSLDSVLRDNGVRLQEFGKRLETFRTDTTCRMQSVLITSGASPEGGAAINKRLAKERAANITSFLRRNAELDTLRFETSIHNVDWCGLEKLVMASDMPYRQEVLDILHNTPEWVIRNGRVVDSRQRQLGMLAGGQPWHYMEEHFFPELRYSAVSIVWDIAPKIVPVFEPIIPKDTIYMRDTIWLYDTVYVEVPVEALKKPFYMALKTNMLYDAALVPNIGVEFYLGKGWTIGGNWMYAWWNSDRKHNYWRIYGGELDVRKYFGKRAKEKPLTGHHLGVYGGIVTYDFELGSTGYLGDKWSYHAGIEYGYSLPIAKRLNIDFGLGIGYLGGEYKKYVPKDSHYVWQATKQRRWFGPTKAEVSLVWLIGHGNTNKGKGGDR